MAFVVNEKIFQSIGKVADNADKMVASEEFYLEYIPIDKIVRNENNFFGIREIDELAESIEQNGLMHNIVVRRQENGKYQIISGERRFEAFCLLRERVGDKYKLIPAQVKQTDDVDAEIGLIQANTEVRQLTPAEQLQSVERLKALYEIKRQRGEKISGKLRERIAATLNMSVGQVGNLENISANLAPDLQQEFRDGKMSIPQALSLLKQHSAEQLSPAERAAAPKKFMRCRVPTADVERFFTGMSKKEVEAKILDILIRYFEEEER